MKKKLEIWICCCLQNALVGGQSLELVEIFSSEKKASEFAAERLRHAEFPYDWEFKILKKEI